VLFVFFFFAHVLVVGSGPSPATGWTRRDLARRDKTLRAVRATWLAFSLAFLDLGGTTSCGDGVAVLMRWSCGFSLCFRKEDALVVAASVGNGRCGAAGVGR
jgi:hypothetical protein